MPHDTKLEARILAILKNTTQIKIKKMFGGIVFMHRGNMLCGIDKNRLMVRVGSEQYDMVLKMKNANEMDITGKPMRGFIFIYPVGMKTQKELKSWIDLGLNFTKTLKKK